MHGRAIVPGLAYPERTFSARATEEEIWAALEVAATPSGRERIWGIHNSSSASAPALRRFTAYIGQARTFYRASMTMDVLSRPLAGYYSLLNLAKAWLTMADPDTTDGVLLHGAGDANQFKTRYRFTQESLRVRNKGIFREIADRTGAGFCYPNGEVLAVTQLVKYLCETSEDYENSIGNFPALLPLSSLQVLRGEAEVEGTVKGVLWLRGEIDKGLLKARKLNSVSLFAEARHFDPYRV
jgi:hypothetical protein